MGNQTNFVLCQKLRQPQQKTLDMSAIIMIRKQSALLHAAVGMVMHVQTRHAAPIPKKVNVVGTVNGLTVCANQQCSKLAQRKVSLEPMCAQRVAHLWTTASSVSLQLVYGRRISARNHGPHARDPGLKVASGTGSSTSSATSLNQVPSIQLGWTKLEPSGESGPSAKS